jgi:DNA mismatch repair protein MutL
LYLVAGTHRGIVIVDQHAAHERILYEQFKEAYEQLEATHESVTLQEPRIIILGQIDTALLSENIETFQKIGFDLELFGTSTFKISAIPKLFSGRDPEIIIQEFLADIKNNTLEKIDQKTNKTLSYLACRTAIKAGDPLSASERKMLIEKMMTMTTPYTCPHGRPTHIELTLPELEKMFKRR